MRNIFSSSFFFIYFLQRIIMQFCYLLILIRNYHYSSFSKFYSYSFLIFAYGYRAHPSFPSGSINTSSTQFLHIFSFMDSFSFSGSFRDLISFIKLLIRVFFGSNLDIAMNSNGKSTLSGDPNSKKPKGVEDDDSIAKAASWYALLCSALFSPLSLFFLPFTSSLIPRNSD